MTALRRSLAVSFAEKYGSYALGHVEMVILGRLLTPKDLGISLLGSLGLLAGNGALAACHDEPDLGRLMRYSLATPSSNHEACQVLPCHLGAAAPA